jgi:hypothetical protein
VSSITWRLIPDLMLLPVLLAAQTTLDSVARHLRPGQRIRLHSQTGQRAEGRFTVYDRDQAAVQLAMRDTTIRFGMVDSLWVRKSGAKTGAIVGGVVVGVPWALLVSALCNMAGGCTQWGAVAGLSLAGAGAGALIRGAVGLARPRRTYLSVESDNHERHASPLLLSPIPGVGQSVSALYAESYSLWDEEQQLRSAQDNEPGVALDPKSYYLVIPPDIPRHYRMRFAWVPGAPALAASH